MVEGVQVFGKGLSRAHIMVNTATRVLDSPMCKNVFCQNLVDLFHVCILVR